jgi:hypothetical protein
MIERHSQLSCLFIDILIYIIPLHYYLLLFRLSQFLAGRFWLIFNGGRWRSKSILNDLYLEKQHLLAHNLANNLGQNLAVLVFMELGALLTLR